MTFSPTHLANFLACRHTLTLELEARAGLREKPTWSDPLADQLRKRGEEHERRYVNSLREKGWVPFRHLAFWWFLLLLGDLVFYVLLTPIWLGLRAAAWIAELTSRVRRS